MKADEAIRADMARRLREHADSARTLEAHYTAKDDGQSAEGYYHAAALYNAAADLIDPPAALPSDPEGVKG